QQTEAAKSKQPFTSDSAQLALNQVIVEHLLRQGRFETAHIFAQEAHVSQSTHVLEACQELFRINDFLKAGDLGPALEWAERNREWLDARESSLGFDLHRSQFIRLLTQPAFDHRSTHSSSNQNVKDKMEIEVELESNNVEDQMMESDSNDSTVQVPIILQTQSNKRDPEEEPQYLEEYSKSREKALKRSPYAEFYRPSDDNHGDDFDCSDLWLHADHLVPLFTKEFYARLQWSKELPLTVATELGSGGALAKIAKVEIPLPLEFRFHSVFACPVSKEQSTESNPPMMMPCGHVIAKESMQKLAKGGGTVKCPYCPSSSSMSSAMQVYF
ncbi:hypothetical protein H4Q26_011329, partial [Puccinia striiformis f. sp. tritici PST-130]